VRTRLTFSWLAALAFAASLPAAASVEGTVVDEDNEPIKGARVCYLEEGAELLCVETDKQGRYALLDSRLDTVRAHAPRYLPVTFSAVDQQAPVVLRRAPALLVRLVDGASGEPIAKGEVFVTFSSGKEMGPFPANAAGVRIRRLITAGEVRVLGKAEGYRDAKPQAVTLVAGEESEVVLELEADGPSGKDD
jgi:hypothetical protein